MNHPAITTQKGTTPAMTTPAETLAIAMHQAAHNALSTACWHVARNELPQALSRLRRAYSHIAAAMEGGAE